MWVFVKRGSTVIVYLKTAFFLGNLLQVLLIREHAKDA